MNKCLQLVKDQWMILSQLSSLQHVVSQSSSTEQSGHYTMHKIIIIITLFNICFQYLVFKTPRFVYIIEKKAVCYARVKPVSQPGKIPNSWKLELLIPQSISFVPWTSRHKTIIFYKEIESIGKSLKNSPNLQNLITGLTQQKTLQVWIKRMALCQRSVVQ